MTFLPSPPNRRRRRVVFAIAVLALVSLVAWCYWPRGDVRFVGKWVFQNLPPDLDITIALDENGTALRRFISRTRATTQKVGWAIEGDQLVLTSVIPYRQSTIGQFISRILKNATGTEYPPIVIEKYSFDLLPTNRIKIEALRPSGSNPFLLPNAEMQRSSE
jgi:hypothetical protein